MRQEGGHDEEVDRLSSHLGVEVADQQDRDSRRHGGEAQPGGPGQGQRGQGSGQSGHRQAWIVGGHWERREQ